MVFDIRDVPRILKGSYLSIFISLPSWKVVLLLCEGGQAKRDIQTFHFSLTECSFIYIDSKMWPTIFYKLFICLENIFSNIFYNTRYFSNYFIFDITFTFTEKSISIVILTVCGFIFLLLIIMLDNNKRRNGADMGFIQKYKY